MEGAMADTKQVGITEGEGDAMPVAPVKTEEAKVDSVDERVSEFSPTRADGIDDGEVDPQVVLMALAVGLQILERIAAGDLSGLDEFVDGVKSEIRRQQNLMKLLDMESDDIDKLIAQLNQVSETNQPAPTGASAAVENASAAVKPTDVIVSPAERMGARRGKGNTLREYLGMA